METASVKSFIEEYFELEYEANIASLDTNLTSRAFSGKYDPLLNRFWGANRFGITHDIEDLKEVMEITNELLAKWKKAYFVRFVFQIEAYKHPTLGEELAAKFPDVTDVYRCVLSNCKETAMPKKMFSDAYSVIKNEGQWKFIYRERFIDGMWEPQNDWPKGHILRFGTLVELADYVVPEEKASLLQFQRTKDKPR